MAKGLKSAINKNKNKKVFFSNIINENDTYNLKFQTILIMH